VLLLFDEVLNFVNRQSALAESFSGNWGQIPNVGAAPTIPRRQILKGTMTRHHPVWHGWTTASARSLVGPTRRALGPARLARLAAIHPHPV